jgi:CheY-like chemotaxis protein
MERAMEPATTILLIEDESIIRMGTAAILEDAGYRVLEAGHAGEAIEILETHPEIDLVVTDVQMPGPVDGLGLVATIGHVHPRIRTLVTSGRATGQDARQCGANKFLSKPYSAADLQSAVQKTLLS